MILKILKVLLPVILIGLIVWNVYPKNNEFETKKQLDEIKQKAEEVVEKNKRDSDEDGLLDWEEELYKTDINNKDTDNDGVSDKDEVDQNRSPIVFGPGLTEDLRDLVSQKDFIEKSLDIPENLNDVEISDGVNSLSEFLSESGYVKQENISQDSQTGQQIEIRKYLNRVADQILLASENSGTLNESLFALYEGKSTKQDKDALSSLALRYKFIGEEIGKINSPESLTAGRALDVSKKYIELSERLYAVIGDGGLYEESSFKEKADAYTKTVAERNTIFVDIHKFVKKEKIYFSPNDSGRFFLFEVIGSV